MDRYRSTGDRGLIGDRQAGALVTSGETVDWFCCPRFGSPSGFAFPGHAGVSYSGAAGTRGQDASAIGLVPDISAIALLAFALHR